ncbi:MAG: hypothetical protein SNJ70_10490, partial [Armatimonadota bacterium]
MTYVTKAKAAFCIIICLAFALSVVPANAGWFGDIFKPKPRPWQKPKAYRVDETGEQIHNIVPFSGRQRTNAC